MIAEFLERPKHAAAVEAYGKRTYQRIGRCSTFDDLLDAIGSPRVNVAVIDLGMCPSGVNFPVAQLLSRRGAPLVIHAIHGLARGETAALRAMSALPCMIRNVYQRYHDLDACLSAHPNIFFPLATLDILALTEGQLSPEAMHLFTCCIVLGERHCVIERVSIESLVAVRDIDPCLANAGLLPCAKLLRQTRLAHAAGRMEKGCEADVAAILAGFKSVRSMENYFSGRLGFTPRQSVKRGAFNSIVRGMFVSP